MASPSPAIAAGQPAAHSCPRQDSLSSLLVRVGGGDRDAFATFYDELSRPVHGMSLSSGHGPALSALLTLDVFVRVWEQAATYDPRVESAWRWVRAIASETIDGAPARK